MKVIHIYGASGSGTSTLGDAISNKFAYKHLDTDDYYWLPTNPPFTTKRERNERISLMERDIQSSEKVVITGSLCGWGDVLIPRFDLAIRVDTPTEIRIKRLEEREYYRFGNRIMPNGDMHEEHCKFIEWASQYDNGDETMRSKVMHDKWADLLLCIKVTVDGSKSLDALLKLLHQYIECNRQTIGF